MNSKMNYLLISILVFLFSRQGMAQYQTLDEIVLNAPNYFQASKQAKLLIEQNDSIPLGDLKRFYRWEWFYRNHINATGNFTAASQNLSSHLKSAWLPLASPKINLKSIGPRNMSNTTYPEGIIGRVACLWVDPDNIDIIFIGTASAGLWKTTDRGLSWVNIAQQIVGGVTSIAVDPTNKNNMYLSSGIYTNGYVGHHFATGLWKSTDGGNNFSPINNGIPETKELFVTQVAIDPISPNILYAVGYKEVYKSIDNGNNWNLVFNSNDPNLKLLDIAIDPITSSIIYISGLYGFYMSTNSGTTWNPVSFPDPEPNKPKSRIAIDVNQNHEIFIYVGKYKNVYGPQDAYYTQAAYLAKAITGNLNPQWTYLKQNTDAMDFCMDVYYFNPSLIYYGHQQSYKMIGVNSTFLQYNIHADIRQFQLRNSGGQNVMFSVHDGGVSVNYTLGNSDWHPINGDLALGEFYDISITETNPDLFIGGVHDNSTFLHTTAGWSRQYSGDGGTSFVNVDNGTTTLFATSNCYLAKRQYPFPENSQWSYVTKIAAYNLPMVQHPTNPNLIYYGNWWVGKIENGVSLGNCVWDTSYHGAVTAIGISKSNPNV